MIIAEGLADQEFIAARTEGYEDLPAVLAAYTPELVEEITGVPADRLREAARLYGSRREGRHLLLDGHHPALARHRARAGPRQPRAAHRQPRPPRHGREPAARPEQRAGRLRHGRAARRLHRLPGGRRPGGATEVRGGLGRRAARPARPRGHRGRSTPWPPAPARALHRRREPDALRPRPAARGRGAQGPRLPRRAGHLPHRDGGARRRRAAGGELRREGRHVHQHRAQRAARARRRAEPR